MGGTIIHRRSLRKSRKIGASERNCKNCKFYYKGICNVLSRQSGRTHYISSVTLAKRCVHFTNFRTEEKPSTLSKTNKRYKREQKKSVKEQIQTAGLLSLPIPEGSHCKLFKVCRVCGVLKHYLEFQVNSKYSHRKTYCRECKITGKVPGKSGKPYVKIE